MSNHDNSPLLLFYPTSPVHVRDMKLVIDRLPNWDCVAIAYRPLETVAPGIGEALNRHGMHKVEFDQDSALESILPAKGSVLVLGAVFEPFALELFVWAKTRDIPVVAIQEVAQLALNQLDINNYDAPFDRLFVASQEERRQFLNLNYPEAMLSVSGLLANDRFNPVTSAQRNALFDRLEIADGKPPIVYTTSPLRSRLALHNKDCRTFRDEILTQLAEAHRLTKRAVVVKLHPNEDVENTAEMIHKIIPNAVVLGRERSIDEILPITGVLVNRGNSQTCLEAVLRGVPTVVAACGLKTLFHDDGGAYVVDSIEALAPTIEKALISGALNVEKVKAHHFYLPANGVADHIAAEIVALQAAPRSADTRVWTWLVKSMLFMGRHDRALALAESVQDPSSRWHELVRSALKAHRDRHVSEEISCWLECAAIAPDWYFPHYELAHCFQANGQFDNAIAHAHRAMDLHPRFHSLWHEIPMRVVIMTSLRSQQDSTAARKELQGLEQRGLVDVVPELLIEAAAQNCAIADQLEVAEKHLGQAVEQLKHYPVDRSADSNISERAARQYIQLAEKHADAGDSARSIAALTSAAALVQSNTTALNDICSLIGELGERREWVADYQLAEQCYTMGIQGNSAAYWLRFCQSRLALRQAQFRQGFQSLFTITRIPEAPRTIIEKILSPAGIARLASYWPASPRSIVKPLVLSLHLSGWLFRRLANFSRQDVLTTATAALLVWLFVFQHFVRRLRSETATLCKLRYRLRSSLLAPFRSPRDRVTQCPVCGAQGKFEYQNKFTPLFRCLDCAHVYARDLPDEQTLQDLYGDFGYWERDRYHQGITAIQESEQWRVYLDARVGILRRLKLLDNPNRPLRRIFEIGCAEGMLLHELRKNGVEVLGCEMNRAVAAQGMKALGVDILIAPFESLDLPTQHFDLVMSFHTLEHLRDPAGVLAKVANVLRPEGAVLLEVPCGEEEYDNTDHLHFFSDTSLRTLLSKYFRTIEILDNSYTNGAGVRIGSIYGFGKDLRANDL